MFSDTDKEALRKAVLASLDHALAAAEESYPDATWRLFEGAVRIGGCEGEEVRTLLLIPLQTPGWPEHLPALVLDGSLEPVGEEPV